MGEADTEQESVWVLDEAVSTGDVLRQGDLIRFSQEGEPSTYGIVVTADCDLDNRKHSRLVTLVPLLSSLEIVCKCLAFDLFETQKDSLQQLCRARLNIEDLPNTLNFLGKLKVMVRESSISDPVIEAAAKAVTHEEFSPSLPILRSMLTEAGVSWAKTLERFARQIESRGDILRLVRPPLISEPVSIVWLRSMWQERVSDIALRTSESQGKKALRVAQLGSPYRYRLTQMLGQVFADIGLPHIPKSALDNEFKEFAA